MFTIDGCLKKDFPNVVYFELMFLQLISTNVIAFSFLIFKPCKIFHILLQLSLHATIGNTSPEMFSQIIKCQFYDMNKVVLQ
jgi:hypothetical protein